MAAQTVASSRMTRAEALQALRLVKVQLVTHRRLCPVCVAARDAKAMRATSWATWTPCADQRSMLHTKLNLEHRLTYLRRQATTAAAREAGMTVGEFMKKQTDEYRRIVAEFSE